MAGISCVNVYWIILPIFLEILAYAWEAEMILKEENSCGFPQRFQSPINIQTLTAIPIITPEPLSLRNLTSNHEAKLEVTNIGSTLNVYLLDDAIVTGGVLNKKYFFRNLHFHWGKTDLKGSEHQLDGAKFSMEAHFVFDRNYKIQIPISCLQYIKHKYDKQKLSSYTKFPLNNSSNCIDKLPCSQTYFSIELQSTLLGVERITTARAEKTAVEYAECQVKDLVKEKEKCNLVKEKGKCKKATTNISSLTRQIVNVRVVVAAFFQLSEKAPDYQILELAKEVIPVGSSVQVPSNKLSEFVKRMNTDNYFTYTGSLTTPPYTDNVIWIVLADPLPISAKQLASLRNLDSENKGKILENFRKVQNLENRTVYHSSNNL